MHVFSWIISIGSIILIWLGSSQAQIADNNRTKPGFDFTNSQCLPTNVNTASKVNIKITLLRQDKKWPATASFRVKRLKHIIFIFYPSSGELAQESSRVTIQKEFRQNDFVMNLKFLPEQDAGVDFEYAYLPAVTGYKWEPFCTAFIGDDMKPKAMLSRRGPPELGVRSKSNYMEGERIIVVCRILKRMNQRFGVIFPEGTKYTEEFMDTEDRKEFSVSLTKNIQGRNISCWVDEGYNVTRDDLLRFLDKPYIPPPVDRTNVAISIAVLFALMLVVMLPIGGYLLIVKQRKDQTKQIVEHHKEDTQIRFQQDVSHMSKMSKSSRLTDIKDPV